MAGNKAELFIDAWKAAGFRIVGHIVFRKEHVASASLLRHHHEVAYLLAKGEVAKSTTVGSSSVVITARESSAISKTSLPVCILPFSPVLPPSPEGFHLDPARRARHAYACGRVGRSPRDTGSPQPRPR